MIRIIRGTYGYLDENGIVKPKTEKDEPFSLTPEQEDRLVGLGVAVYVDTPVKDKAHEDIDRAQVQKLLEEMTAKELRELGKEYGLSFKVGTTKAEMVEAIQQYAAAQEPEDDDAEDDDEDMPAFDATEAVK